MGTPRDATDACGLSVSARIEWLVGHIDRQIDVCVVCSGYMCKPHVLTYITHVQVVTQTADEWL